MIQRISLFLLLLLASAGASAQFDAMGGFGQDMRYDDYYASPDSTRRGFGAKLSSRKKSQEKDAPIGLRTFTVSPFARTDSVVPDTMPQAFMNSVFTDGRHGEYNTLGNLASPRQARLFGLRPMDFSQFIFCDPYDYFLTPFESLHFTRTLSPITNLSYHECGDRTNGEDHLRAFYAVNAGKDVGFGFKFDYAYGRGYYDHQQTADFNFTLWGSVEKERYRAYFRGYTNQIKTAENGGIQSDDYVKNPSKFPSSFVTNDIPVRIDGAYNKMHINGAELVHRYSLGYVRQRVEMPTDSMQAEADAQAQAARDEMQNAMPMKKREREAMTQAQRARMDSLAAAAQGKTLTADTIRTFVPVTSVIHTFRLEGNERRFTSRQDLGEFYYNRYFAGTRTDDMFRYTGVTNRVAVELHEGFNRWAVAGIRLYGQHEYMRFGLPVDVARCESETENRFTLGACLFEENNPYLRYSVQGQTSGSGEAWGDFELNARLTMGRPVLGCRLSLQGDVVNRQPTLLYRKFRSHYLWWDNDLSKQMTTHVGGTLESERTHTRLTVDLRNIKNYTYFATDAIQAAGQALPLYNTCVRQAGDNLQVVSAQLSQDFRLGPLNWENMATWQAASDKEVLPLPTVSLYSNLYLLFKVARVLRVELGADVRYFTEYDAPTYSPALGMFATQAEGDRVKVGNHPIVNVYANCHLKHTRFYIMGQHVNYSKEGGNVFLAPHYPYEPMVIRFGLSWNFFN